MKVNMHKTVPLGEVIVAVYDKAAYYSADPEEVSRIATEAVLHVIRDANKKVKQTCSPSE